MQFCEIQDFGNFSLQAIQNSPILCKNSKKQLVWVPKRWPSLKGQNLTFCLSRDSTKVSVVCFIAAKSKMEGNWLILSSILGFNGIECLQKTKNSKIQPMVSIFEHLRMSGRWFRKTYIMVRKRESWPGKGFQDLVVNVTIW